MPVPFVPLIRGFASESISEPTFTRLDVVSLKPAKVRLRDRRLENVMKIGFAEVWTMDCGSKSSRSVTVVLCCLYCSVCAESSTMFWTETEFLAPNSGRIVRVVFLEPFSYRCYSESVTGFLLGFREQSSISGLWKFGKLFAPTMWKTFALSEWNFESLCCCPWCVRMQSTLRIFETLVSLFLLWMYLSAKRNSERFIAARDLSTAWRTAELTTHQRKKPPRSSDDPSGNRPWRHVWSLLHQRAHCEP